ncbi:App1 family protein [Thiohalomonas denitrificans]|uniref:App1 family protein n=1 Tax=Thiohalomonas denitrificans TaxID=415747 RepID=UPI001FE041D7|nr:phosphatase domain-containing protein [Thiohalomonas denitrificans]
MLKAFRQAMHILSSPVRGEARRRGLIIQPYRGYGTRQEICLMGRVYRQAGPLFGREGSLLGDVGDIGRRVMRRGQADVIVRASFGGTEQRVNTDRDGYFRIHLRTRQAPANQHWHSVALRLVQPPEPESDTEGQVYIPPDSARHVIISDIDDTVVFTGVANKIGMLWRLFMQGPKSRTAFPGVSALYRGLHEGPGGGEHNPILYVSRGPWGLYELLEEFFQLHNIPVGPIMFLREWGLSPLRPFPRRDEGHKLDLIRTMLALYADMPFVLVGDSGQQDPEVYTRIVQEYPGRVSAVYIRNVSLGPKRVGAIKQLAEQIAAAGSTLVLAADSFAMARHAEAHGLLAPEALERILEEEEREEESAEPHLQRRVTVTGRDPVRARELVERELGEQQHGIEIPDVVVETEKNRPK